MTDQEKEIFKNRIKNAIKISSLKLIEEKKKLGQTLVVSINGKIMMVNP